MTLSTVSIAEVSAAGSAVADVRYQSRRGNASGSRTLPFDRFLICTLVAVPAGATLLAWTGDASLTACWGLLCFGLAFVTGLLLWAKPEEVPAPPVLFAFAAVPIVGLVQLCFAHTAYRFATELTVLQWAAVASLLFSGLWILRSTRNRELMLSALLVFAVAATVLEVVQIFGYERYGTLHTGLPLLSSNNYAELMELLLPIALRRAFTRPNRMLYYTALATLIVATVFGSGARTGSVLVTIEVVALFASNFRHPASSKVKIKVLLLFFAVLLGALVALEGPHTLVTRLRESDPLAGRRDISHASNRMFQQNWKFGTGLGTFAYAYPAYATFDNGYEINSAHDDWLELGLEGGILVPLLLLGGTLSLARKAWSSGWGLGILFLAAHSFVDFPLHRLGVLTTFTVLIAALSTEKSKLDRKVSSNRTSLDSIARTL